MLEFSREKLSCIIGSKNAEADIGECLESAKWADEIILVDDFSSDRTIEIAKSYTDKIFQREFDGYTQQKDFAVQNTSCRWVLSLDADERVTPELKNEILEKLSSSPQVAVFLMRRRTFFLGKEIKHCGWQEANCPRLFDKEKTSFDTSVKYLSRMKICGRREVLQNSLLHYTCNSLNDYFNRLNLWTGLNTEDLIHKGRKITPLNCLYYFFFQPAAVFFDKYFLKAGYRDGSVGFFICLLSAITYFISYAKLWERQNEKIA